MLELVLRVFGEFVGPDFSDEGVAEFERSARRFLIESPDDHAVTVAISEGALVGMIDVRDASHVCLFFVDAAYQRRGVGAALLTAAVERARGHDSLVDAITVNSGPAAVSAYRALGFAETAPESNVNGIRFVPMRLQLASRVSQAHRADGTR